MNCRQSKHRKKLIFTNLYIFTTLYLLVGNRLNLDPDLITDPEPKLQIIPDPAGSRSTTLVNILENMPTSPAPYVGGIKRANAIWEKDEKKNKKRGNEKTKEERRI